MRQLTGQQRDTLKKKLKERLEQEVEQMIDDAWEEAVASTRGALKNVFIEMIMEKLLDQPIDNHTGCKLLQQKEGDGPKEQPSLGEEAEPGRQDQTQQQKNHELTHVYLYCLAPIDAAGLLEEQAVDGLPDGDMVRGVRCGQVAAIVSTVPAEAYNDEVLEACVQDMEWLENRVTVHDQVIQCVMKSFPVIPMKFCTIFHSEHSLCQVMAVRQDEFISLLNYVNNREEWGLKAYCDPAVWRQYVEKASEEIDEARIKVANEGSGAAYLMKKKMEELIIAEMDRMATDLMEQLHQDLATLSVTAKLNRLMSGEVTGRSGKMALNAVYLVDINRVELFKQKLEIQTQNYQDRGFAFELTGPWPPYNFSCVNKFGGGGDGGDI